MPRYRIVAALDNDSSERATALLVIGASKRRALSRFVLGSTAYKVLTTIKCPIFAVQEVVSRKVRALPVKLTLTAASA